MTYTYLNIMLILLLPLILSNFDSLNTKVRDFLANLHKPALPHILNGSYNGDTDFLDKQVKKQSLLDLLILVICLLALVELRVGHHTHGTITWRVKTLIISGHRVKVYKLKLFHLTLFEEQSLRLPICRDANVDYFLLIVNVSEDDLFLEV